jgi:hypothetical protein
MNPAKEYLHGKTAWPEEDAIEDMGHNCRDLNN